MSAVKELLTSLAAEAALDEELGGRITEAHEFDMSDYAEQLTAAQAAEGEANTNIAELTDKVAALEADLLAVKAMNFDSLVNGDTAGAGPDEGVQHEDPLDDPELTLDELIELSTKKD